MSRAVKDPPTGLQDAVADMQQPGTSTTIEGNGKKAKIEDPRAVCLEIAGEIEAAAVALEAARKEVADALGEKATVAEVENGVRKLFKLGEWNERGVDPWPRTDDGKPVEYLGAELAARIGLELTRRIHRLGHLHVFEVDYVYRHKETWESKGRTVYGKLQKPSGLLKHYSDRDYVVLLNWRIWQAMTPWQKVALVYHELRHSELDGKTRGHDFEGFFDELELFGTGTYREWHRLAEAAGSGAEVEVQYHLPLLDRELEEESDG